MAEPGPLSPRDRTLPMPFDLLPSALRATILSRLDIRSLLSAAATCSSFRSSADHVLSFAPSFHFLDIAPTLEVLHSLMALNPYLRILKVDCGQLRDSAIGFLAWPSLHELCLHNCVKLSGKLLAEIGSKCRDLRFLSLSSLAERSGLSILFSDLEELLRGCSALESLSLVFHTPAFTHPEFAQLWAGASEKLSYLEIAHIPTTMLTELLKSTEASFQPPHHVKPSIFPSLQKLYLSVDYITDLLISSVSNGLVSLTHLDLQDSPLGEPDADMNLTNAGLPEINPYGKLKHLSLVRSQKFCFTYFGQVNDLGLLLMSGTCASLESICLGGFCHATDTGFRAILHSCSRLRMLRVSNGSQLTDLMFHGISATSLSLTHVSVRWCYLLTNLGIIELSSNTNLSVLDLRDCKKLGDDALKALSSLSKLHSLQLNNTDITDLGLSYLSSGICPLISLSLRGCKRLTDKCISFIFGGSFGRFLQVLDLSRLPNLSDNGILSLAKSRVPILELRIRECPCIGDTSVMALASYVSSLRVLDLFESGDIMPCAIQWFKKPYFPSLRLLGLTFCLKTYAVVALGRSRPFLHVAYRGEELGTGYLDASAGWFRHEEYEVDHYEEWLLYCLSQTDDEDMLE